MYQDDKTEPVHVCGNRWTIGGWVTLAAQNTGYDELFFLLQIVKKKQQQMLDILDQADDNLVDEGQQHSEKNPSNQQVMSKLQKQMRIVMERLFDQTGKKIPLLTMFLLMWTKPTHFNSLNCCPLVLMVAKKKQSWGSPMCKLT